MAYTQSLYPIVRKQNLARGVYDYTVHCPEMAAEAVPGQFVHIRVPGFMLRRPISICGIDREKGNLRLVMEVRGEGTEVLSRLNEGELIDLMGPLGHGFTLLSPDKKAVVIGGGIGVPPLLGAIAHYGRNGTAITGFRSASAVILQEDFQAAGAKTVLCTDDGTKGEKRVCHRRAPETAGDGDARYPLRLRADADAEGGRKDGGRKGHRMRNFVGRADGLRGRRLPLGAPAGR